MTAVLSQNSQVGKPVETEATAPAQNFNANLGKALGAHAGNKLFKSRGLRSFNMFTAAGRPIIFVNGMFQTADTELSDYLENEIKKGHPDIYVDPNEPTFDPVKYDPRAALRREIMLELEREGLLRAAGDPNRDMGSSNQGVLKPTSTTDIAPVAAGAGPVIQVGSKKV